MKLIQAGNEKVCTGRMSEEIMEVEKMQPGDVIRFGTNSEKSASRIAHRLRRYMEYRGREDLIIIHRRKCGNAVYVIAEVNEA